MKPYYILLAILSLCSLSFCLSPLAVAEPYVRASCFLDDEPIKWTCIPGHDSLPCGNEYELTHARAEAAYDALLAATQAGDLAGVQSTLASGVPTKDIIAYLSYNERSPLLIASIKGYTAIAEALIHAGLPLNEQEGLSLSDKLKITAGQLTERALTCPAELLCTHLMTTTQNQSGPPPSALHPCIMP